MANAAPQPAGAGLKLHGEEEVAVAGLPEVQVMQRLFEGGLRKLADYHAVGEQFRRLSEDAEFAGRGTRWRGKVSAASGASASGLNKCLQFRQLYREGEAESESALRRIFDLLINGGSIVTMSANPEFDLDKHDASDSKTKFGYYFSLAEPGNGGLLRFHPGGFEKERELTLEFRRWERAFINDIAADVGFTAEWHNPFISIEGLETYSASFFENYLANPQSKLLRLTRTV